MDRRTINGMTMWNGDEDGSGTSDPRRRRPQYIRDPYYPYPPVDAYGRPMIPRRPYPPPEQEGVSWEEEPSFVQENVGGSSGYPEEYGPWSQPPPQVPPGYRRPGYDDQGIPTVDFGAAVPRSGISGVGRFSPREIRDLAISTAVMTLAFSFAFVGGFLGALTRGVWAFLLIMLVTFPAVLGGFILHEMGHKYVAQSYGCWAEFVMSVQSLLMALGFAAVIGILFGGAGAVQIRGRIDRVQNGKLSLAGPAINMAMTMAALPVVVFTPSSTFLWQIGFTVAGVNAMLGLFNLLPFSWGEHQLDGKKVLAWSSGIWGGSMALAVVLLIIIYQYAAESAICGAGQIRF